MATYIPLFPVYDEITLGENDCYLQLMDDFNLDRRSMWDISDLVDDFGRVSVNEVIQKQFLLKQRNEQVKLSFLVVGTLSNKILELVQDEPNSCAELLIKLPRHLKLSSLDLKNQLSFLYNFNKIQIFAPPGCAITFVASDGPDHDMNHPTEKFIDKIYHFSDRIEPKFAYQMPIDETAEEFKQLIS